MGSGSYNSIKRSECGETTRVSEAENLKVVFGAGGHLVHCSVHIDFFAGANTKISSGILYWTGHNNYNEYNSINAGGVIILMLKSLGNQFFNDHHYHHFINIIINIMIVVVVIVMMTSIGNLSARHNYNYDDIYIAVCQHSYTSLFRASRLRTMLHFLWLWCSFISHLIIIVIALFFYW